MDKDAKKKKEGLEATRAANAKAAVNKAKKEAKSLGDKALLTIAADLPAGGAKTLVAQVHALDAAYAKRAEANLVIKGIRATLKENKIELRPLDHVLKLRKMDPDDAKSFKATEALYTETLGMELSPQQKDQVEEIQKKRADSRNALLSAHGDAGEEVGSGTEDEGEEVVGIPAKNETIALAAAPAVGSTH